MRYLISGYYGERNLGDEAILAGMLQEIARHDPQADFTVLSFSPEDTARRHQVKAIPTSLKNLRLLRATMAASDLLISGGGSFLHEADFDLYGRSFLLRQGKLRPVPYFLSIVLVARAQGLPVFWYAQGLGPLHTATARRLVAAAASGSAALTWRDRDSAALAAEIGARAPVEAVVPDPAYSLEPSSRQETGAILGRLGLDGGVPGSPSSCPFLAVCPRPWLGRKVFQARLANALAESRASLAAGGLELDLVFVPFHERLDLPLCRELAADSRLASYAQVLEGVEDARAVAGVLGSALLAVGMRLHSGILAAVAGTPAVLIDYDPKIRAHAWQTGQQSWMVGVDELESELGERRLGEAIVATARSAAERRRRLARRVEPLRREAGRTARLATQLAAGGRS